MNGVSCAKMMKNKSVYQHRQATYQSALKIIHAVNRADDALVQLGITLNFDDDKTPIGAAMGVLLSSPKDIICEALDLTLRTEPAFYTGDDGRQIEIQLDIYYPDNGNTDFSISYEELMSMIDKAAESSVYAEKLWSCFADNNLEAQEWLQQAGAAGWPVQP